MLSGGLCFFWFFLVSYVLALEFLFKEPLTGQFYTKMKILQSKMKILQ